MFSNTIYSLYALFYLHPPPAPQPHPCHHHTVYPKIYTNHECDYIMCYPTWDPLKGYMGVNNWGRTRQRPHRYTITLLISLWEGRGVRLPESISPRVIAVLAGICFFIWVLQRSGDWVTAQTTAKEERPFSCSPPVPASVHPVKCAEHIFQKCWLERALKIISLNLQHQKL